MAFCIEYMLFDCFAARLAPIWCAETSKTFKWYDSAARNECISQIHYFIPHLIQFQRGKFELIWLQTICWNWFRCFLSKGKFVDNYENQFY